MIKEITFDKDGSASRSRSVSVLLGIGIFFLPLIFVWFLLRDGYSKTARIVGFGWLVFSFIIVFAGGNTPPPSTATRETPAATAPVSDVAKAQAPAEAEPSTNWTYSEDKDAMRGTTTRFAIVTSENQVSFGFPYGTQSATLQLRRRAQDGVQVMFGVGEGQILCNSFTDTYINVKFDDGPVQRFGCTGTSDGSSDVAFITGAQRFIGKLRSAKRVIIEPEFYQAGRQQYIFEVAGLEWK